MSEPYTDRQIIEGFLRYTPEQWDALSLSERRAATRSLPCHIRCWRIGEASFYRNGVCVECGKPEPPKNRDEELFDELSKDLDVRDLTGDQETV